MPKITKDSALKQVLDRPEAEKILAKHNVPCLSCPMLKLEMDQLTIGQICETYNLDLKALLKDLNKS